MKTIIKTIRIVLWITACIVFLFALLYLYGSFEMYPTPEQEEKTRIFSILLMVISSVGGGVLFLTRKKK